MSVNSGRRYYFVMGIYYCAHGYFCPIYMFQAGGFGSILIRFVLVCDVAARIL